MKCIKTPQADFFVAGCTSFLDLFVDSYYNGEAYDKGHIDQLMEVGALVYCKLDKRVYDCVFDENGILNRHPIRNDQAASLGSGSPFALGAMDMGATAKEATKVAAGRDLMTGGKISTYRYKS